MKKLTVLLALIILTSQTTGCGLFRRVRDHFCRGAFCGAPQQPLIQQPLIQRPGLILPQNPQTVVAPTPPVVIPQASVAPCPCVTCSPVCDPCCDGLAYPVGTGFGGCETCNGGVVGSSVIDGGVIDGSDTRGLSDSVFPGPAN